jgi:predicted CXXCH cytochrome family protein
MVGCVDEKIVYKDAPRFQNPPASAAKYLGYTDTTNKVTACGNCHTGQQALWKLTKHSTAWKDLQANVGKAAYCNACHTVGHNGNADTTTLAGYASTKDARYTDVQCENCHGPGLDHATSPSTTNRPLASLKADTGLKANGTCAECHSGIHNPYVQDWKASNHGTMPNSASPKTNVACQGCHTGQGALQAWGVDYATNYKEKNFANADTLPITCGVCHDPHGSGIGKQLRFPIDINDPDRNLCMKCHQRRAVADTTPAGRTSPHSPEGPMLYGSAGWEPPGIDVPNTAATHGNVNANPKLCAGCHMGRRTVTDTAGNFSYQYTGHQFVAVPCVDGTGKPTASQTCALTPAYVSGTAGRDYTSCASSSCHGNTPAQVAISLNSKVASVTALATELNRLIKLAPATELTVSKWTVAKGATFNLNLAATVTGTGASTVIAAKPGSIAHNPARLDGLLAASITVVKSTYGVAIRADIAQLINKIAAQQKLIDKTTGTPLQVFGGAGQQ